MPFLYAVKQNRMKKRTLSAIVLESYSPSVRIPINGRFQADYKLQPYY